MQTPYKIAQTGNELGFQMYNIDLKKNKKSLPLIDKINDIKQPLLKDSLNQLFQLAKEKNAHGVIKYLNFLKTLYDNKEATLLYAFALPLKDYKNK